MTPFLTTWRTSLYRLSPAVLVLTYYLLDGSGPCYSASAPALAPACW